MVRAAKKAGIIAMMGSQQRGQEHYPPAVEIVRSGRLGTISLVECGSCMKIGKGWQTPVIQGDPTENFDWDRWLGAAPLVPFDSRCLYEYPFWFDYGGGMMTNWGVHDIDNHPLGNTGGLGGDGPVVWEANMSSRRYGIPRTRSRPVGSVLTSWCNTGCADRAGFPPGSPTPLDHGIAFYGDRATLLLDHLGYAVYDERDLKHPAENAGPTPQDGPWHRTFVDCAKHRRQPPVDIEDSHRATVCCHLGNITYHTQRTIRWDGKTEQILGDDEAAAMLSRPRRHGYELPEVVVTS